MSGEYNCCPSILSLSSVAPEIGPVCSVPVTDGGSWLTLSNHWRNPVLVSVCTRMEALCTWLKGNEKETYPKYERQRPSHQSCSVPTACPAESLMTRFSTTLWLSSMQAPAPICVANEGKVCGGETGYFPLQVSGDGLAAQGAYRSSQGLQ